MIDSGNILLVLTSNFTGMDTVEIGYMYRVLMGGVLMFSENVIQLGLIRFFVKIRAHTHAH